MAINLLPILISEIVAISVVGFLVSKVDPNKQVSQINRNFPLSQVNRNLPVNQLSTIKPQDIDKLIQTLKDKGFHLNNEIDSESFKKHFLEQLKLLDTNDDTKEAAFKIFEKFYNKIKEAEKDNTNELDLDSDNEDNKEFRELVTSKLENIRQEIENDKIELGKQQKQINAQQKFIEELQKLKKCSTDLTTSSSTEQGFFSKFFTKNTSSANQSESSNKSTSLPSVPTINSTLSTREKQIKEAADREAADREAADREAADREAADREAADREAANREAADREAADREAAAREAAAREAAISSEAKAREATAREEADRQAVIAKEAADRETAAREAQDREAAAREAKTREEAAAREVAAREEAVRQAAIAREATDREEAARKVTADREAADRADREAANKAAREAEAREEVDREDKVPTNRSNPTAEVPRNSLADRNQLLTVQRTIAVDIQNASASLAQAEHLATGVSNSTVEESQAVAITRREQERLERAEQAQKKITEALQPPTIPDTEETPNPVPIPVEELPQSQKGELSINILDISNLEQIKTQLVKFFTEFIIELNLGLEDKINLITKDDFKLQNTNFIDLSKILKIFDNYLITNPDENNLLINRETEGFNAIYPFALLTSNEKNLETALEMSNKFRLISKYYSPFIILQKRGAEYHCLNRENIHEFYRINNTSRQLDYNKINDEITNNQILMMILILKFDLVELSKIKIPSNQKMPETRLLKIKDYQKPKPSEIPLNTLIQYGGDYFTVNNKIPINISIQDRIFKGSILNQFKNEFIKNISLINSSQNTSKLPLTTSNMIGGAIKLSDKIDPLFNFTKNINVEKDDLFINIHKTHTDSDNINKESIIQEILNNEIFLVLIIKLLRIIIYTKSLKTNSFNKTILIDLFISFMTILLLSFIVNKEIVEYILADIFTSFILIFLINIIYEKYKIEEEDISKKNSQRKFLIFILLIIPYNNII